MTSPLEVIPELEGSTEQTIPSMDQIKTLLELQRFEPMFPVREQRPLYQLAWSKYLSALLHVFQGAQQPMRMTMVCQLDQASSPRPSSTNNPGSLIAARRQANANVESL